VGSENGDNYDEPLEDNPRSSIQTEDESIQIISNVQNMKQVYFSLLRNSQQEVLLVFPTTNAVRREERLGVFTELRRACQRGVTVRLLTPEDDFVAAYLDELRKNGSVVRQIESSPAETKFKLLIVDGKFSLVIETKNDAKGIFEEAVGLATFSNSKPTVLPYVTIFESFWRETDLYEKAREADRLKEEFVNIAAHELRNPICPIIASAELAMESIGTLRGEGKLDNLTLDDLNENISVIARNASRLYKLSEDILQVSRIESGSFTLHLEQVEIKNLLETAIQDARKNVLTENKPVDIRLDYRLADRFIIFCDSSKISQVLYNLLDNAVKFTENGTITVSAVKFDDSSLVFKVEDSGIGISPEIKTRLFEKFVSRSNGGTGLGLYLSRRIIDAHGGKIGGINNQSGVGATFFFTLPTDLRSPAHDPYTNTEKAAAHIGDDKHPQEEAFEGHNPGYLEHRARNLL
jgi:two-component system, OmpR family, sensor histidine kinase VicK